MDERWNTRPLRSVSRDSDASQLYDVERVLRAYGVWAVAPADLEARVMRAATAPMPTAQPQTTPGRVSVFARLGHRLAVWRSGWSTALARPAMLVTATAAVAVVAGSLGSAAFLNDDDGGTDVGTMKLAATALAPGASADVAIRDTPSGTKVTVDANGLPPAPKGTYYEAWMVGARGAVAIGTFHLRGGSRDVVLWSGVELSDYPKLTITTQQEGGGPASSRRVVLAGEIPVKLRHSQRSEGESLLDQRGRPGRG
ncbi:anti-sigma factor [Micromonospora chersina]|uniref:anti-sigma factor n=1 Tax=Micromonospora chersina TaxID=47854 RepID=UPI00371C4251